MTRLVKVALAAACITLVPASAAFGARYDADSVIVKYRSGVSKSERLSLFDRTGVDRTIGSVGGVNASVVRVSGDPRSVATRLNRSSLVDYAEPNYILRASATPNDSLYGEMYGLSNTGQTGGTSDADIDAPEGWDAAGLAAFPASGGVKIGIVDTGIDRSHPDLQGKVADCAESIGILPIFSGQIREGRCSDDNGHGTHVAGTISASTNNGQGVAGVSFNSPLTICRALSGPLGTGSTADVANCINWTAQKGAKVISMSLGGGNSTTLQNAVRSASNAGALLIAAAGNDGDATLNYPAAYPEVVSVAATDDDDARASFSNANADVEIAAPGVNILSTYLGGGYDTLSGTSMATPHVSGVAGVVWTQNPSFGASAVRSRLTSTVDDLGPAGRDPSFGFGRANLCKAAGGSCGYTPGA